MLALLMARGMELSSCSPVHALCVEWLVLVSERSWYELSSWRLERRIRAVVSSCPELIITSCPFAHGSNRGLS